jgi:hypothetical protein
MLQWFAARAERPSRSYPSNVSVGFAYLGRHASTADRRREFHAVVNNVRRTLESSDREWIVGRWVGFRPYPAVTPGSPDRAAPAPLGPQSAFVQCVGQCCRRLGLPGLWPVGQPRQTSLRWSERRVSPLGGMPSPRPRLEPRDECARLRRWLCPSSRRCWRRRCSMPEVILRRLGWSTMPFGVARPAERY